MTGPTGRPLHVGSSANDIMGGLFGVLSVLAALMEREETGKAAACALACLRTACFCGAAYGAVRA